MNNTIYYIRSKIPHIQYHKLLHPITNLSIKLYRICVCYTNITLYHVISRYITLYIAFDRSWNVLP